MVMRAEVRKLAERRASGHEPEPKAPSEEMLLLREIRDALAGPRPEMPTPTMHAHDPAVDRSGDGFPQGSSPVDTVRVASSRLVVPVGG
jgi:hypothetical protein